jgi:hypothetical protein
MTIIKRETEAMGRIHVCDAYAATCDDPESQLDLSNGAKDRENFQRDSHWVGRGTGTPKDKDERKAAALARVRPTFPLSWAEKAARRKWNWSLVDCAD